MSAMTVSDATKEFVQQVIEKNVQHDGSTRFYEALVNAEYRAIGVNPRGGFRTVGGDISPLVAATQAVWGLVNFEIPEEIEVEDTKKFVGKAISGSSNSKPVVPVLSGAKSRSVKTMSF